jgi:hypothetical protein
MREHADQRRSAEVSISKSPGQLTRIEVMKHAVLGAILSLIALYAGDYALAKSKPLGTVQVQPFYAIHQKNGKTEFDYSSLPPETQTCVASLLPHFGNNPCWYVTKHKTRKIEI